MQLLLLAGKYELSAISEGHSNHSCSNCLQNRGNSISDVKEYKKLAQLPSLKAVVLSGKPLLPFSNVANREVPNEQLLSLIHYL
jgi:hypothetical protein